MRIGLRALTTAALSSFARTLPAEMVAPTLTLPSVLVTEHLLDVPVDHRVPQGQTINLFVREARPPSSLFPRRQHRARRR